MTIIYFPVTSSEENTFENHWNHTEKKEPTGNLYQFYYFCSITNII